MSECMSLATSRACPMYADASVRAGVLFNTVEEFDRLVESRIKGDLGRQCQTFQNEGLRYQVSLGCSMIVGISKSDCSNPPPVCGAFISAAAQSMTTLAKGTCTVPQPIQNHLTDSQNAGANCRPAIQKEVSLCGFPTAEEQKQYCFKAQFADTCCESVKPAADPSVLPTKGTISQSLNIGKLQKIESDRYLGTSKFIFATVGSTILSIILTTLFIFLIIKRQIQQDRRPQNPPKRIAEKVASRTSFYF